MRKITAREAKKIMDRLGLDYGDDGITFYAYDEDDDEIIEFYSKKERDDYFREYYPESSAR